MKGEDSLFSRPGSLSSFATKRERGFGVRQQEACRSTASRKTTTSAHDQQTDGDCEGFSRNVIC